MSNMTKYEVIGMVDDIIERRMPEHYITYVQRNIAASALDTLYLTKQIDKALYSDLIDYYNKKRY